MDYKNTLNLPKTDFAMKADLVTREPLRLDQWEKDGLYQKIQEARAAAEKFILHDGPPFANGDVHIGTALNKILKDIIIKHETIQGKAAPYVPGWDCHGLPIEFKVSQELRKAGRADASPAEIRRACEEYARKYIDLQRTQFKRLGVLGDWENPYLTLNKEYEADELRLFADIVERGFVYRGKKPVYWSIPCRTALAEAEVEYQDHVSQSVYVKFPIAGENGMFVLIWTTTPWTLPANLAVAYNSTFDYTLVRVGHEAFLVSVGLLSDVAAKCGWEGYEIIRTVRGDQLSQLRYQHPFINRTGRFFAGDHFVENSTGTGFVHIAPGHGLEDYGVGLQNGLPIYSPVNDDGCFEHTDELPADQQMPEELLGKSILEKKGRSDANDAVLALLQAKNALAHREDYAHSYPHCWRSKTPVIFRAMDQWFIKVDHEGFREKALDWIDKVQWTPDWGKNRIEAAVKGRPDWCISRQRSWGVPIPAFYTADRRPVLSPEIIRNTAALIEREGSNAWFERSVEELWAEVKPSNWDGADPVAKSADTLDVWIDSGSSSRAVLMRRSELQRAEATEDLGLGASNAGLPPTGQWQADMYLEGSDQHRGWFQSSLLLSLAGNGAPPYRTVLTHGFLVDADREKISKSKQGQGGYEKPQTAEAYVGTYGADVLRLWVASQDYRNDVIVSEERIKKVAETYRVLRNTLRYQLSNLYDFDPSKHVVERDKMPGLDRWVLGAFASLERQVKEAYQRHEFHLVYQRVSQFAAVELSAIYHDLVKDRLYTDPAASTRRRATQTALHRMVIGLCQMLSPILTFTTDEAWEFIPGVNESSVHLSVWQPSDDAPDDEASQWAQLLQLREEILPYLEKARQGKVIGKSLEAKLKVIGDPRTEPLRLAKARQDEFREVMNVSQLEVQLEESAGSSPGLNEVIVAHADGAKCGRCWHWELDVGRHENHPGLCGRCVEAVESAAQTH